MPANKVIRFPASRLLGPALARNNGRVAFESELCVERSNPYRRGSRNHSLFIEGYEWARRQWLGAA